MRIGVMTVRHAVDNTLKTRGYGTDIAKFYDC